MSPPDRPKGECRRAQLDGSPMNTPGRSQALDPQRAAPRAVR